MNSFEQIYKTYFPRLVAYASLILKTDGAYDIVQDVFLSLLEKSDKMPDESTISAYLYKAVQNKCVDAIRHKTVKDQYACEAGKKLLQIESEYFYSSRNEIEDALLSQELQEQIDTAVETLPPKGKEVFKLYFDHQKTAPEIASILQISKRTVENHIYTCIKALRQKLADYFI